jgi:hypothetical protein
MLSTDQTTELAELFRLLGEPNRLGTVTSCLDGPLSVGEITLGWGSASRWCLTICVCCAPRGC